MVCKGNIKRYNCIIPECEVEQSRGFFSFKEFPWRIMGLRVTSVISHKTSRKICSATRKLLITTLTNILTENQCIHIFEVFKYSFVWLQSKLGLEIKETELFLPHTNLHIQIVLLVPTKALNHIIHQQHINYTNCVNKIWWFYIYKKTRACTHTHNPPPT
jgi:hypothetical protein